MLVADCCCLQKIVCVFFGLGFGDVLLDVFVKADSLMQIDCFQIIEIYVREDLF